MPDDWKTVRVFISSTFRDMQAERDHLVRFVFPRLRERLLSRRVHLVDVDLRWGVTGEQDASEVCREIIHECRPRFLCMLGGRYGTVPAGKELSITADEIHFGVLDARQERMFAFFYFRHGAVTEQMNRSRPGFAREGKEKPEDKERARKLASLKREIRRSYRPYLYRPTWNADEGRLVDLKTFGDQVEHDILASIAAELGSEQPAPLDEFGEENAAMEAFVAERSGRFVLGGRKAVLDALLTHASTADGNNYVCLTGPPGSGKSALLTHLSRHPALEAQRSTLVVRHFVGASSGSADVRRTLRRLCHELQTACPDMTRDIPDDPEKLREAFQEYLRGACERRRVVILLDAVNQFDATPQLGGLEWLPREVPAKARFILSAVDGPAAEELGRLSVQPRMVRLESLAPADRAEIVAQFRRR